MKSLKNVFKKQKRLQTAKKSILTSFQVGKAPESWLVNLSFVFSVAYRHQSSSSLSKSVSLHSELWIVVCPAVDVPVVAVVDRRRVQVSVAHCAREAPLVPRLKKSWQFSTFQIISFFTMWPRLCIASLGLCCWCENYFRLPCRCSTVEGQFNKFSCDSISFQKLHLTNWTLFPGNYSLWDEIVSKNQLMFWELTSTPS